MCIPPVRGDRNLAGKHPSAVLYQKEERKKTGLCIIMGQNTDIKERIEFP
jgi:hypothetical protein